MCGCVLFPSLQPPDLLPVGEFSQQVIYQGQVENISKQPDDNQVEPVGANGKAPQLLIRGIKMGSAIVGKRFHIDGTVFTDQPVVPLNKQLALV